MTWLIFLALLINRVLGQDMEPKILQDAKDYYGFPRNFRGLTVSTNQVNGAKFYWKHNGVLIDTNYKPPFRYPNRVYLIPAKTPDRHQGYEGYYQFIMQTSAGTISSRNTSVQFTYVGSFVTFDGVETHDVTVGQATYLNCPPEKSPGRNIIYKWGKTSGAGGTKFVAPSPYYIVLNNGTLFFSHLLQRHVTYINALQVRCGMYAVVGIENWFTWSRLVGMNVVNANFTKFGPEMVSPLPRKTFEEGERISMKCAATGNPLPIYSWTLTDDYGVTKPIEDGKNGVEFEDGDLRILVITSAQQRNSGTYRCTATVNGTSAFVEGRLKYGEKPYWEEPKIKSVTPSLFSSHTWQCNATGNPEPTITWYVNATKLKNRPGRYRIDGGKISFARLLKEDSGMYQCVAQNELDNIYQNAQLDVQGSPPQLVGRASGYSDLADYFSQLKCNIEGDSLNYEWFHNGTRIPENTPNFFLARNSLYVTKRPITEDLQGVYQCRASNVYGSLLGPELVVSFTIVGTFYESEDKSQAVDVTVGKDLKLDCPPRSLSRNVYYHWGGRRGVRGVWFIPQQSHYMIMEDGSLLFANVRNEDIELFNVEKNGVSCSMESKGTTKKLSFSQRILLRQTNENKVPFGPTIKTPLKDREVAIGTEFIILRCGAAGLPTPTYSWTVTRFDGFERRISNGKDDYDLSDFNHILTIKSINVKHDGLYKCKAESSYGGKEHVDVMEGRISVKGKPRWIPGGKPSTATHREGDTFRWFCLANGHPKPSYRWQLNRQNLTNTKSRFVAGGILTFRKVSLEDGGVYECIAENKFGHISSVAELQLIPAAQICKILKINLLFLVDGSGSVPVATFKEFKMFMKLLVKRFVVGPSATHVGVLQYSSKERTGLEFDLGQYQTMHDLQHALSGIVYHYGAYTYGGHAMKMANQIMDRYSRKDAKNVMVVLMDDGLWDKTLARRQSKELRKKGTQIIMLDTKTVMSELADLALPFTTDKLEDNAEKVAQKICQ